MNLDIIFFYFKSQTIEEIDSLQQKLTERTDKLNAMKNRHNELTQTLDETETHLKQASEQNCHANRFFLINKKKKTEMRTIKACMVQK